jgi:hypothetical protein
MSKEPETNGQGADVRKKKDGGGKPEAEYPFGMLPVRNHDWKPTRGELNAKDINTETTPQAQRSAWRGPGWRALSWTMLMLTLLDALLIYGSAATLELKGGFMAFIVIAAATIIVAALSYFAGHETVRVGVDPGTNTLWIARARKTNFLANANCISGFGIHKFSVKTAPRLHSSGGSAEPGSAGARITWHLMAEYSNGIQNIFFDEKFQKKSEAKFFSAEAARMLNHSQSKRSTDN